MDLEIISQLPSQPADLPPILFIHGAFTDAWCWDEHFLPYFADQGYPSYALSLRGHGKSKGELLTASLNDYLQDVLQVVESFEKKTDFSWAFDGRNGCSKISCKSTSCASRNFNGITTAVGINEFNQLLNDDATVFSVAIGNDVRDGLCVRTNFATSIGFSTIKF